MKFQGEENTAKCTKQAHRSIMFASLVTVYGEARSFSEDHLLPLFVKRVAGGTKM